MKLAFTNDSIYGYASGDPSAVGGAERQQWLLARALAKAGWSVTVGVSEKLKLGTRTAIDGVAFVGIGRGQGHILSAWCRFLMAEQPGWWYWRCSSHLLGPAVTAAKVLNVRTIFSAALDPDVNPRLALFHRPGWWPLYAWGLSWVDKIFVQHRGQFVGLASHLRRKSFIVPSIAGERVAMKPHANRAGYVAWIGQLKQAKRPELLIEMAHRLSDVRFVVCGGPSTFMSPPGYSEQVTNKLRAQPNIEFLGQVPPGRALRVVQDAAVLLSTSDAEGFPNTFLEAWSSGTPVVSLKCDPDSAIDRFGLGVVAASEEIAAHAVRLLMASPKRRDEIGCKARRYIAEAHSEVVVTTLFNRAILSQTAHTPAQLN